MGKKLDRLLSISSDAFVLDNVVMSPEVRAVAGGLWKELESLLSCKNGFFAFEGALRVFSSKKNEFSESLDVWNSPELWRSSYVGLADGCVFFAEDIFGGQFCIKNGNVYSFDPETGDLAFISRSIEGWADEVLSDYEVITGSPIAHQWQEANGVLSHGQRLMPKVPFVCGGEFDIGNLLAVNVVTGMKSRANLAVQIRDMPDGAQIQFNIIE
ncbi:SMI1/KNR4 family protein [Endozoicomonas ascidiicola]|uniref:SMI1/KNR4 family protein n=1 Tax=Endozoicomonas ascidiicola TaxID=1698521 RepID=UPI00082D1D27|nr:SMI1/KNR4 family protein [Endozoicomonas ascidiicola]